MDVKPLTVKNLATTDLRSPDGRGNTPGNIIIDPTFIVKALTRKRTLPVQLVNYPFSHTISERVRNVNCI